MCGLTGYNPRNNKSKPNMDWIKIILSYNAERGDDSCGFYMNGKIDKSLGCVKDYISENQLKVTGKNKTIIVHNRKSSKGAVTLQNAHPFEITNGERTMTFCHNGTVHNIEEMAKKRNFNTNGMFVDSLILGHLILNFGYEVLSEYNGGTALLWTYNDEPNTLYAFKGASKNNEKSKEESEERPLNVYMHNSGIYFSSLIAPLKAIADNKLDLKSLAANCVYKFQDDKIEILSKIDRSESYQEKIFKYVYHNQNNDDFDYSQYNKDINKQQPKLFPSKTKLTCDILDNTQIYDEVPNKKGICYVGLRYFWLKEEDKFTSFDNLSTSDLLNGFYKKTTQGDIIYCMEKTDLYFYQGIRIMASSIDSFINTQLEYIELKSKHEKYIILSRYTHNPICFLPDECQSTSLDFYHNGLVLTAYNNPGFKSFKGSYADGIRLYAFYQGNLNRITSDDENDIILVDDIEHGGVFVSIPIFKDVWIVREEQDVLQEAEIRELEKRMVLDPEASYYIEEAEFTGREILLDVLTPIIEEHEVKIWNNGEELELWVQEFINDCITNEVNMIEYIKGKYDLNINEKIYDRIEEMLLVS